MPENKSEISSDTSISTRMSGRIEPTFLERRLTIKDWLKEKAPVLGGLYEGAVISLYSEPSFPGWPDFVCHAIREIRNRLPDFVGSSEAQIGGRNFTPNNAAREIARIWQEENLPHPVLQELNIVATDISSSTPTINPLVQIPHSIYGILSRLVIDDGEIQSRKYRTAERLFRALIPEEEYSDKEPAIQEWINECDFFDTRMHVSRGNSQEQNILEYREKFEIVERILYGLIQSKENYSALPDELDEILESTNS